MTNNFGQSKLVLNLVTEWKVSPKESLIAKNCQIKQSKYATKEGARISSQVDEFFSDKNRKKASENQSTNFHKPELFDYNNNLKLILSMKKTVK